MSKVFLSLSNIKYNSPTNNVTNNPSSQYSLPGFELMPSLLSVSSHYHKTMSPTQKKNHLLLRRLIFHPFVLFKNLLFQLFLLSAQIVDFVGEAPLLLVKVLLVVHGLRQQLVVLCQKQRHLKED